MCLDIVSTRKMSRLGLVSYTRGSRSRLGQFGKRLGLVSVSGAQVSVLVSVSTQKVLGPSLLSSYYPTEMVVLLLVLLRRDHLCSATLLDYDICRTKLKIDDCAFSISKSWVQGSGLWNFVPESLGQMSDLKFSKI